MRSRATSEFRESSRDTPAAAEGAETPTPEPSAERVTWRGVVVGLAVSAALAAVVSRIVLLARNTDPMLGYMPFGALVTLLLLARVGAWVGRRVPALRLGRPDALLVYCMLLAVSGMAGSGGLFVLFPLLTGPFYYASQSPLWEKLLHPHIPTWLAVRDPQAVLELYRGGQGGVPWPVWAAPLTAWGIQFLFFFWTSLCLVGMFRRRWVHAEHLAYPLAQIPLEIAGLGPGTAVRGSGPQTASLDRRLWIGAAVTLGLHSLNTLHAWFPNIPGIQLSGIPIGQSFVERPWSVMSDLRIHVSFATIGIAYLMPTELSFSFIFFYFFNFFQRIVLELYGVGGAGGDSVWNLWEMGKKEQLGGFAVFALFLFWSGRADFAAMFRGRNGADQGRTTKDERGREAAHPDRWMVVGFAVGLVGLCLWSWVAGMGVGVALAFFAAVLALMLSFARMVSASGLPAAQTDAFPSDLLMPFTGAVGLGARNLTLMAFEERVLSRRGQYAVAPSLAQVFKIADTARIPTRVLVPALLLALVVALGVSTTQALPLLYAHGGEQLPPSWFFGYGDREPFEVAESRLTNAMAPRIEHQAFVLVGALLMGLMIAAHRSFLWWPLHPMGFLMAYGWQITALWFSFLIGALIVTFINRFLGARVYWQLRPLFVGFILGEALAAALWLLLDALAGVGSHSLPLFV